MEKKANDKISKKLWIELIIAILGVIGTSVAITLYFNKNIVNQNYEQIAEEIKNQTIQIEEMNNTINRITNEYYNEYYNENYLSLVDDNTSVETLLEYAENSYLAKNYEVVATIYSMEKLENNVIANTNLGYMYANGEYFDQNDEMADKYYDKAISMNSMEALNNKIALHMRKKKDDCIELLKQGYKEKDKNISEFVTSHFEGFEEYTKEQKENMTGQFLYTTTEGDRTAIFDKFYYWDEESIVYLSYSPHDDDFTRYIMVSQHNVSQGKATVTGYKKYVYKCGGIGFLEEHFVMR